MRRLTMAEVAATVEGAVAVMAEEAAGMDERKDILTGLGYLPARNDFEMAN